MIIHQPTKHYENPTFKQKLLAGITFIESWGFSINEGGYWTNLHISWNLPAYYFHFYTRIWGNLRISWMWKKPCFEQRRKEMLTRAAIIYDDAMKNGIRISIPKTEEERAASKARIEAINSKEGILK